MLLILVTVELRNTTLCDTIIDTSIFHRRSVTEPTLAQPTNAAMCCEQTVCLYFFGVIFGNNILFVAFVRPLLRMLRVQLKVKGGACSKL